MSDFIPGTVLAEEADEASTEKVVLFQRRTTQKQELYPNRRGKMKDLIVCPLE